MTIVDAKVTVLCDRCYETYFEEFKTIDKEKECSIELNEINIRTKLESEGWVLMPHSDICPNCMALKPGEKISWRKYK